jgi:predicted PurR-regulated permease PerM
MEKIFQRANQYLFFLVLLVVVMYFGKTILIPLIFGALLAMLMAPLCRKLDKKGLHRALSTLICILIIVLTIVGIGAVIGGQIASFSKDAPKIEKKSKELMTQGQQFIEEKLGVTPEKQKEIAKKEASKSSTQKGSMVSRILGSIVSTIAGLVLTMVFTFLMIFNKEHFEEFFIKLYKDEDETKVKKVVGEIATVSQKYLTGRVMSILINATLYAIGLSLVGVKNAILLAGVAALLTLIPYVGTVLGGLIPVAMALVTEDSIQPALWAAAVLFFIQTVDNYFIEPNIVGGEVNLNALATILVLIIGGLIWGPAGMILFLPLTGIVKIVADHVEELKPIGHLLGEPGGKKPSKIKLWLQSKFSKKKRGK